MTCNVFNGTLNPAQSIIVLAQCEQVAERQSKSIETGKT